MLSMKRRIAAVGALVSLGLLATACAALPRGDNVPPPSPVTTVHFVRETQFLLTAQEWERSPWYRPSQDAFARKAPVYLVIADGDWACPVDAGTWVAVTSGQRLECQWRVARRDPWHRR